MQRNIFTMHSAASATANGSELDVEDYSIAAFQVTGTFAATITFEGTVDNTNWVAIEAINIATGAKATTATAAGIYRMGIGSLLKVRARLTWTSGTSITVTGILTNAADPMIQDIALAANSGVDIGDVDVADRIGRLLGKMTNYDVLANGSLTALNSTVELACAGLGTVGLGVSGTWAGTIVAEIEVGNGVWDVVPLIEQTLAGASLSTTASGNWLLGVAGALTLRIRMSLYTSGTATVYLEGSSIASGMFLSRSIPTGVNAIGTVGVTSITAGETHIGEVGGPHAVVSDTFARPNDTTGYTAKDAVSNTGAAANRTFTNIARVNAGSGIIIKARLMSDNKALVGRYRLHLFNAAPTAIADNSPYLLLYANAASRIGTIDFAAMATEDPTNSTASMSLNTSIRLAFTCAAASRTLYGILETLDAYTPGASTNYYLELEAEVN